MASRSSFHGPHRFIHAPHRSTGFHISPGLKDVVAFLIPFALLTGAAVLVAQVIPWN